MCIKGIPGRVSIDTLSGYSITSWWCCSMSQSILSHHKIDTWSTSWWTLAQHSIDSWSIVGRMSTDSYILIDTPCLICENKSTVNGVFTEYQCRCRSSIDWDVNDCRLREGDFFVLKEYKSNYIIVNLMITRHWWKRALSFLYGQPGMVSLKIFWAWGYGIWKMNLCYHQSS